MSDIVFHSVFPSSEVKKEKGAEGGKDGRRREIGGGGGGGATVTVSPVESGGEGKPRARNSSGFCCEEKG